MISLPATTDGEAQRTDPKSFLVRAVALMGQMIIPLVIGAYTIIDDGKLADVIAYVIPLIIVVIGINVALAYLGWLRFTYRVGEEDIRVESGIVSRAARSVPYERIQDVSLEQQLIPRLFGLVEVKFETGSGGGEDLKLSYLTEGEGARLRELVRAWRASDAEAATKTEAALEPMEEQSETLFAMQSPRLLKFGLFEFSLAIVAVLFGVTQQFEFLLPFELWDLDAWQQQLAGPGAWLAGLGPLAQVLGAFIAALSLILVGLVTGIARTFAREWGFLLERTSRGFRRRRGLFTRTDVVMPAHRVQAIKIGTRFLRYRFGWHGLSFVSLAQDAGSSNHVVAPFAQMEEIAPIVRAAGFAPPASDLEWHRASRRYRFDSAFYDSLPFVLVAIPVAIAAPVGFALLPLAGAAIAAAANLYGWQFHRHALDDNQVLSTKGYLSPATQIASRVKLHSIEISQGPIAQRRGYATVNLGLAGGNFSMPGIPLERARELRAAILTSIATKDFSELA
ncbi:PH domain-containing protein [Altererythrobacter arenosus]|uniref:PH domain-containing protein n=1 Tax=Altererythrobacter arenosus TaxID=3032592 RepID=A0ABY8FXP3_9SPHN|nr:PH domain-containing protein [Altererythrobacter sp. CAU 1644]WFL78768.1 PH domain-containing protein [Altererythrobacter sp. CAU 1644]